MIIGDCINFQEKNLLTEILYNRKVVLVWDFTEIKKVKEEMASTHKIWIIEYKT